ncbi:uncharacterized protein LOC104442997 [Eucalyptus grandis]|uniref:uncharacterized protein LOC104442997 n=1 Tax=Eucalyptus grandis TaxID=71139 RepID=UPI00192ED001|nr:uncharacterized protein LOC104442997 [Eucalyptus grandis]
MAMSCFATARESVKRKRALPPAHFSLKIESFEVLSKLDKYDSGVFKAGGHEWRLSLYPKGNKDDNGSGYISLYLSIEYRLNKTVYVNYKLFVHDKLRKEYLTIQDADEAISCFHGSKTRCGFPRFSSLKEFKKRSNGYLDEKYSCTFGAEVFVIEPDKVKEESFTLIRYPEQSTFTLKIENWSTLGTDPRFIEFDCEKRKWKLLVYQKGNEAGKGKSLSVYLEVQRLTEKMQVYADFNLRVLDQLKGKHKEKQFERWLSASHPQVGDADFMPLKDLEKSKKGFVQNDALVVEVQIRIVSGPGIVPSKPGQGIVPSKPRPRVAPSKPGLGITPLQPGLGINKFLEDSVYVYFQAVDSAEARRRGRSSGFRVPARAPADAGSGAGVADGGSCGEGLDAGCDDSGSSESVTGRHGDAGNRIVAAAGTSDLQAERPRRLDLGSAAAATSRAERGVARRCSGAAVLHVEACDHGGDRSAMVQRTAPASGV